MLELFQSCDQMCCRSVTSLRSLCILLSVDVEKKLRVLSAAQEVHGEQPVQSSFPNSTQIIFFMQFSVKKTNEFNI